MDRIKNLKNQKLIVIVILIIVIGLVYFLFNGSFKNRYVKMEEALVEKAKAYVLNNNIKSTNEVYFDTSKLGLNLDSDCSMISGVFYHNGEYKAYLSCDKYHTNIVENNMNIKDIISLLGDDVIIIPKGINYTEPGYYSKENVNIVGEISTSEGVYNLYYEAVNSNVVAQRKIVVINNDTIKEMFPSIELVGEKDVYLVKNNDYQEFGVKAWDSVDNDITDKIIIDKNIDTTVVGEYKVNYKITNSRGYTNSTVRNIHVIESNSDLNINYTITPDNLTNQNVTINLIIDGRYQKIVYPDGKEGNELEYSVDINGNYEFTIYDEFNRIVKKVIEIKNIDKELPKASCTAVLYYNRTEIKVVNPTKQIIKYQYLIDNNLFEFTSNTYTTSIVKPTVVKVKITDSINNENELTCTTENQLTRKIVTNSKGKNCLEGMVCYVQFDYGDARNYPFCSVNNNANACGGIGQNGCSITSASIVIANMGVKSKTGVVHTPYTVWNELYPINKKTGQCGGGCSGWSRIRDSIINAGLTAEREEKRLNSKTLSNVINNLKKGYPVIIYASRKPFSNGTAHYMTLLGIREDGYVFLSDSANTKGTKKNYYNNKQYYVDTWISPDDLLTGNVKEYLLVGPKGVFEGK